MFKTKRTAVASFQKHQGAVNTLHWQAPSPQQKQGRQWQTHTCSEAPPAVQQPEDTSSAIKRHIRQQSVRRAGKGACGVSAGKPQQTRHHGATPHHNTHAAEGTLQPTATPAGCCCCCWHHRPCTHWVCRMSNPHPCLVHVVATPPTTRHTNCQYLIIQTSAGTKIGLVVNLLYATGGGGPPHHHTTPWCVLQEAREATTTTPREPVLCARTWLLLGVCVHVSV